MSSFLPSWPILRAEIVAHKLQLRFTLRLTLAALLAFALAQPWSFPLRGLWAVLTAIVVTQVSVGGSILAITEYVVGTLAGVVYASAIALLIPHKTTLGLSAALALSIVPMALSAALNPMFRVGPFTAAIVLLISTEYQQSPLESAIYRMLEVLLGGMSVIVVSLLILPEKPHERGLKAAADILERLAQALPALLSGISRDLGALGALRIHEGLGAAITQFQSIIRETRRERLTYFHQALEFDSLARILLRLRHDFVIIGRATATPFPESFAERLGPSVAKASETISAFLQTCGNALAVRRQPPVLDDVEAAIAEYDAAFSTLRYEGLTRPLSGAESKRIFALGFALEQLYHDLLDLRHCAEEYTETQIQSRAAE